MKKYITLRLVKIGLIQNYAELHQLTNSKNLQQVRTRVCTLYVSRHTNRTGNCRINATINRGHDWFRK